MDGKHTFDGRACLDEKRAAKRQPSLDWLIANKDMLPKLQKAKEREENGACGMKRGRARTQPNATCGKTHAMRMLAEHSALKRYKVNMTSLMTEREILKRHTDRGGVSDVSLWKMVLTAEKERNSLVEVAYPLAGQQERRG